MPNNAMYGTYETPAAMKVKAVIGKRYKEQREKSGKKLKSSEARGRAHPAFKRIQEDIAKRGTSKAAALKASRGAY